MRVAALRSFKWGSLLMLILRQLFDIGWEAAIYKTYTSPAGGRLTYQSDRHACICCCHISRLRQRSDISDSHSFARRVYLASVSPSGLRIGRLCGMNLSASISCVPIRSKRLTTVCASLCSFKRCSLLMLIPEQALGYRIGRRTYTKKERIHTVYVSC